MTAKKIGILTGGGDCPGLNAVIRAVVPVVGVLKTIDQFADAEVFFG